MLSRKITVHAKNASGCILMLALLFGTSTLRAEEISVDTFTLAPVMVTAQKKEENVQDIPASVDVFTEIFLEEAGIDDTLELQRYIPNYVLRDGITNYIPYMRGVGGFDTSLFSGTAMYIDDINVPLVFQTDQTLFDVERVEVLKGPQGTLYGGNSEAGVINIVTRRPDNNVEGKISLDVSAHDTNHGFSPAYSIGANVSGPIIEDSLFFSLAGKWNQDKGTIRNEFTNNDNAAEVRNFYGRGELRWTPSERWDISLIVDVNDENRDMGVGQYLDGLYNSGGFGLIYADEDESARHATGNSQSLRVEYSGELLNVLSITGRREFNEDSSWDGDATNPQLLGFADLDMFQDTNLELWSQEFRLSSNEENTSPLSWIVGVYAYTQSYNGTFSTLFDMPAFGLTPSDERRYTNIDMNGIAFFGEATYTVFDRLHLTAGLRYDHLQQEGTQNYNFGSNVNPVTFMPIPYMSMQSTYSATLTSNEWLPKFSIRYDFNENAMLYASVSKGYLAGGFDYVTGNAADFTYEPEYTWNYEMGVKTTWFDERLTVNLAAFYIDMNDKQVSEVTAANTATISNAAGAESMGLELEIQANPIEGLSLYANFGLMHTNITNWYDPHSVNSFTGIVGPYNYAGNDLPFSPTFSYSLGATYMHVTGIYGRIDILGNSGFYYTAKNTEQERESAYATVNLRLGYLANDFEISAYCNNVFDTEYYTSRNNIQGYGLLAFEGAPREIGINFTYRF